MSETITGPPSLSTWVMTFDGVSTFELRDTGQGRTRVGARTFAASEVQSAKVGGLLLATIVLTDGTILRLPTPHAATDKQRLTALMQWASSLARPQQAATNPNPVKPKVRDIAAYITAERRRTGRKPTMAEAIAALAGPDRGQVVAKFAGVTLYEKWIDAGPDGQGAVSGATATVETAGNIYARRTFTRVVMMGGLFATQAKKDARELYLLIEAPEFVISVEVDPSKGAEARTLAARVTTQGRRTGDENPMPPAVIEGPARRLEQLDDLQAAGLISQDEYDAKRAEIISQL